MIVSPMFWFWIGVFAQVEVYMTQHRDLVIDYILTPSPLALYLKEAT